MKALKPGPAVPPRDPHKGRYQINGVNVRKNKIAGRVAKAHFTTTWDQAKALHRTMPRIRKRLKEAYGIDNIRMEFVHPWGGRARTGFSFIVELPNRTTARTAADVTKWLRRIGRGWLSSLDRRS